MLFSENTNCVSWHLPWRQSEVSGITGICQLFAVFTRCYQGVGANEQCLSRSNVTFVILARFQVWHRRQHFAGMAFRGRGPPGCLRGQFPSPPMHSNVSRLTTSPLPATALPPESWHCDQSSSSSWGEPGGLTLTVSGPRGLKPWRGNTPTRLRRWGIRPRSWHFNCFRNTSDKFDRGNVTDLGFEKNGS